VTFYGFIPQNELKAFYQSASVFVLPAITDPTGDTEGLGVVMLEAMSCSVPVIASRVGGIPDIVNDGVTGLLVEEKDSFELAEAIKRVLTDDVLKTHIVENANRAVQTKFNWEHIAKLVLQEYETILDFSG
jgi:glycosyltransferase involved in cell wall biosynthesis